MARLVQHNAKVPTPVKSPADGSPAYICACGLSKNQPYCDGSHNMTSNEDENKLYEYDGSQNRKELSESPRQYSVY